MMVQAAAETFTFSVNAQDGHIQAVNSCGGWTGEGTAVDSVSNCTVTYWWPQYWQPYTVQDKTGTAFRIAQKLMEKKLVSVKDDVHKFVKLVNEIVDCL